jgi:predicted TIM-barrel fold metal-dependent hydrolase
VFTRPNPLRGRLLSDPAYDDVYAAASEQQMSVCIHEGAETSLPQVGRGRVDTMFARHILCHPAEQMSAMLSMITDGVFDRFPELRVAYLECGCGWLPFWLDRLEALSCSPVLRDGYRAELPPREYFRRGQIYTSCEAGEETVALVGRTIGEDNLMWASDYPHPEVIMTFPHTLQPFVDDASISSDFKRKILWDNPARFYGLEVGPSQS